VVAGKNATQPIRDDSAVAATKAPTAAPVTTKPTPEALFIELFVVVAGGVALEVVNTQVANAAYMSLFGTGGGGGGGSSSTGEGEGGSSSTGGGGGSSSTAAPVTGGGGGGLGTSSSTTAGAKEAPGAAAGEDSDTPTYYPTYFPSTLVEKEAKEAADAADDMGNKAVLPVAPEVGATAPDTNAAENEKDITIRTRRLGVGLGVGMESTNSNEEQERALQLDNVVNDVENNVNDVENNVKDTVADVKDNVNNVVDNVDEGVKDTVNDVKDTVNDVNEGVKDTVNNVNEGVKDTVNDVKDTVNDVNEGVKDTVNNVNKAFIPGNSKFDRDDIVITAFAVQQSCTDQYGENIPAGSQCLQTFVTFDSSSGDLSEADLELMSTNVEDTIESGTFAEELLKTGLTADVIVPEPPALATDAPTGEPTIEETDDLFSGDDDLFEELFDPTISIIPSAEPTVAVEPTIEPTITVVDYCPAMEDCGDCTKGIGGIDCLWCIDTKTCYNADPVIAERSALNPDATISKRQRHLQQEQNQRHQRFLQAVAAPTYVSCEKLSASKPDDCVLADTAPPTVVPVDGTIPPTPVDVPPPTVAPVVPKPPSEAPTYNPTAIFGTVEEDFAESAESGSSSSLLSSWSVMTTTILSGIVGMTLVLFSTM